MSLFLFVLEEIIVCLISIVVSDKKSISQLENKKLV